MKKTENGTPCCEQTQATSPCGCAPGTNCCGTPAGWKLKMLVCLAVLLAIAAIAAYKLSVASRNTDGGKCCPSATSSCCPD